MKRRSLLALLVASLVFVPLEANEDRPTSKEHPAHKELRALREGILDAFNKGDIDRLLTFTHKNVVATWQNGEVSRGHEGLRDYYRRMMTGEKRVVQSVKAEVEVDDLTLLYGDNNGLAFGSLGEDFVLTDGRRFHLDNRWTAYLVKEEDRWQIAGLHVSVNVFENAILKKAIESTAWWVGGGAALAGLLLGFIFGRVQARRTATQS